MPPLTIEELRRLSLAVARRALEAMRADIIMLSKADEISARDLDNITLAALASAAAAAAHGILGTEDAAAYFATLAADIAAGDCDLALH